MLTLDVCGFASTKLAVSGVGHISRRTLCMTVSKSTSAVEGFRGNCFAELPEKYNFLSFYQIVVHNTIAHKYMYSKMCANCRCPSMWLKSYFRA